jgi:hypothetical protein
MDAQAPLHQRHYFRCHDCLATVCIEAERAPDLPECGICGGELDYLGRVTADGWRREHREVIVVCDVSCQTAQGPDCKCACGGGNHGIGIGYRMVVEEGKVIITAATNSAKHLARAEEYRAALASAIARTERTLGDDWLIFRSRGWIQDKARWWECHTTQKALDAAQEARQHKSRMSTLAEIFPEAAR